MTELKDQPTARPTRKVQAQAITGALVAGVIVILNWLVPGFPAHLFMQSVEPAILVGVTGGLSVLSGLVAGYCFRDRDE